MQWSLVKSERPVENDPLIRLFPWQSREYKWVSEYALGSELLREPKRWPSEEQAIPP